MIIIYIYIVTVMHIYVSQASKLWMQEVPTWGVSTSIITKYIIMFSNLLKLIYFRELSERGQINKHQLFNKINCQSFHQFNFYGFISDLLIIY